MDHTTTRFPFDDELPAMSTVGSGFIVGGAMNVSSDPDDVRGLGLLGLLVLRSIIGTIGIGTPSSS